MRVGGRTANVGVLGELERRVQPQPASGVGGQGLRVRVWGSGFGVQGLGIRVWGSGLQVWGRRIGGSRWVSGLRCCRTNIAHVRQSRPDAGLGVQASVLGGLSLQAKKSLNALSCYVFARRTRVSNLGTGGKGHGWFQQIHMS